MQKEVDDLGARLESKQDEFELLEREYKKLQDKHRDTLNSEYAL
jgi:chromosome segregation ATPase